MKLMMLIILTVIASICKAQNATTPPELPYVGELQNHGVDTILVYSNAVSAGYYFPLIAGNTTNYSFASRFVFWKKNGKNYFYYKSPEAYYPVQEFNNESFWNFYFGNRNVIDTENFKKALVKTVDIETEQITISALPLSPGYADRASREIEVYIDWKEIKKRFLENDFVQFFWGGRENMSYAFNIRTKTAQFQKVIDDFCKDFLKDKKPIASGQ